MLTRPKLFLVSVMLAAPVLGQAAQPTPVGTWRTFDDEDGRESGAVTIFERDGKLYGAVAAIANPAKRDSVCIACTDDRKGKPVMGLQIIRGLRPDGDQWDGGEILDPKNGKTYKCSMRLEDGGNKLSVRGYIGFSLLGRTQTWLRQPG